MHNIERSSTAQTSGYRKTIGWLIASLVFMFILTIIVGTCNTSPGIKTFSKHRSIEITIETQQTNEYTLLKTVKHAYIKGKMVREVLDIDTFPALEDTTMLAEDDNGNVKRIVDKKDYDIFITLK